MSTYWRKCSSCKKEIPLKGKYYECSVSTCNGKRTGYVFCSVPCFEVHLPGARHKDAAAIENMAPNVPFDAPEASSPGGQRRIIRSTPATTTTHSTTTSTPSAISTGNGLKNEVLIVASKLKKYIQDEAGMNTSQSVMNVLSDIVRKACDEAIKNAHQDGRKTVMDRDFK